MICAPPASPVSSIYYGQPMNRQCPLNKGLVLWFVGLPLTKGSNTWQNLCGAPHAGLVNATAPTVWRGNYGRPGGFASVEFDSSSNHGFLISSYDSRIGTGDFTMQYWVRPASVAAFQSGMSFYGTLSGVMNGIWHGNSGGNWMYWNGSARVSGQTLTTNTWNLLCVVRRAGVIEFYNNGVATGTTYSTDSSDIAAASNFHIGVDNSFSNDSNAVIDDVRVFNVAKSAGDVWNLYLDSMQGYQKTLNRIRRRSYAAVAAAGGVFTPYYYHLAS